MTIGERIRLLRDKKSMTQTDIAKILGIATQTVFKYEKNIVTNIPLDTIEALAKIFDVSPAYLMGWEDSPEPVHSSDAEFAALPEDEKDLVSDYRKLNTTGKGKVREYTKDLSEHERYTKKDKTTSSDPDRSSRARTTANFDDDIERISVFGGIFIDDDEAHTT